MDDQEVIDALTERNPFIVWAAKGAADCRRELAGLLRNEEPVSNMSPWSPLSEANDPRHGSPACRAKAASMTDEQVYAALLGLNPFVDHRGHYIPEEARKRLVSYLYAHAGEDIAGGIAADIDDV